MDVSTLTRKLGYRFSNTDLLRQALTHRSYGTPNNERLEFLGDSVLNCVIACELFKRFPQVPEGDLSRLRANLVNQQSLRAIAQQAGVGACLLLGEGELKSGGAQRPSILADTLEALIGAAFIDGGFEASRGLVQHLFDPLLAAADPRALGKDAKTLLQEFLQARRLSLPQYSVLSTAGEAHEQTFRVECAIPELNIRTQGEGTSRRGAEQVAAQRAYDLGSRA